MLGNVDMIVIVVVLLGLVFAGAHIAIALGITAALGLYLMTGDLEVVRTFTANTAYEALRDYVFAVIPLFMLMGDFLAKCGAARDLYALGNRASKWLPGRLAAATIVANALFGFVTGVSIAAAAAFSRIAYPEMRRFGYRKDHRADGADAGALGRRAQAEPDRAERAEDQRDHEQGRENHLAEFFVGRLGGRGHGGTERLR